VGKIATDKTSIYASILRGSLSRGKVNIFLANREIVEYNIVVLVGAWLVMSARSIWFYW